MVFKDLICVFIIKFLMWFTVILYESYYTRWFNMGKVKGVDLRKIIEKFGLEIISGNDDGIMINTSDLYRPGLELAGFFDYFPFERIQVLGMTEINFLNGLDKKTRKERLEKLLSYSVPCLIITRGLSIPSELLEISKEKGRLILRSYSPTTNLISKLTDYLESELAPRTTMHGVLMDIYGVGVLLIGESGIGKSETAVELLKRGHRLIADDVVEIKQVAKNVLVGMAPEILKYYLEVRGLGIIDVKTIFGAGAVREDIRIDLVIELVEWEKYSEKDRFGIEDEKINILESYISKKIVPIRPGRNLAAIIEVAAMNHRLKTMGYNAALNFSKKLCEEINNKKGAG